MTELIKIKSRKYQCPLCGWEYFATTNHINEIYSGCELCDSSVLYCVEEDAIKARSEESYITAKITYYRFDINSTKQLKQYVELRQSLEKTHKLFDATAEGFGKSHRATEIFKGKSGTLIRLYKREQFDGQYVSDIGRVHDWYEWIFPNKYVKCGYYLTVEKGKGGSTGRKRDKMHDEKSANNYIFKFLKTRGLEKEDELIDIYIYDEVFSKTNNWLKGIRQSDLKRLLENALKQWKLNSNTRKGGSK